MPQCITADPTILDVSTLDESAGAVYVVRVTAAAPRIQIIFAPPQTQSSRGVVTGVQVSPSGPECGADWVAFTTSDIGTEYTVQVTYDEPTRPDEERATPLETPTKSPKFKPQSTCPPSGP